MRSRSAALHEPDVSAARSSSPGPMPASSQSTGGCAGRPLAVLDEDVGRVVVAVDDARRPGSQPCHDTLPDRGHGVERARRRQRQRALERDAQGGLVVAQQVRAAGGDRTRVQPAGPASARPRPRRRPRPPARAARRGRIRGSASAGPARRSCRSSRPHRDPRGPARRGRPPARARDRAAARAWRRPRARPAPGRP